MKEKHEKQLVIIGIIAILVSVGLSGCQEDILKIDDKKFIGTWVCHRENSTITFTQDHTYQSIHSSWGDKGTYEVKNGQLVLTLSNSNLVFSFDYLFSSNSQIFALLDNISNEAVVFTKS